MAALHTPASELRFPTVHASLTPNSIRVFLNRVGDADPAQSCDDASFDSVVAEWQALGLRPGDLVLLVMPNGKALLHHYFAVLLSAGVPALVGPNAPSSRLSEIAQTMGASWIASVRPLVAEGRGSTRIARRGLIVQQIAGNTPPAVAPGEAVLLTSGTSGFSSGCVFDFSALLLNAQRHADSIGQRESDTVLINLPLHFSFALVAQALASFVCGNRLVIGGPPFHVPTYLKTLTQLNVTVSSLTPVLVQTLLGADQMLPDGLRILTVGGDTLAPQKVQDLLRRRPAQELYLTYGLTQAGPRVSTLAAHNEPASRYGSVGKPIAGTRVYLEDVAGAPALRELVVSSATVMKRRIGTTAVASESSAVVQGVVRTGDVFEQDPEGYLYFKTRLADFVTRKGEKVCLAAVRDVAARLPNVIRAKTFVSRHDDDYDFELVLHTSPGEPIDYHEMLRTWLRGAEMPRTIRVVRDSDAHAFK